MRPYRIYKMGIKNDPKKSNRNLWKAIVKSWNSYDCLERINKVLKHQHREHKALKYYRCNYTLRKRERFFSSSRRYCLTGEIARVITRWTLTIDYEMKHITREIFLSVNVSKQLRFTCKKNVDLESHWFNKERERVKFLSGETLK